MSATTPETLLEEALELWRFTREGVISEVESIPADRFDFRPADGARTLAGIVHHIVEAGVMGFTELTRPDGDFQRLPPEKFFEEHAANVPAAATKDELLALLRSTHAQGERLFRETGEVGMLQRIRRFDGETSTRLAWFWHLIDHESYHRGQVAMYARQIGLIPALTRLIHGDDAA
ncbi:MAG: DinB family protein [Gemmatimonadota bacterium]|jgi:uncharacterized damage-inducible protein DinB